jgi:hypothetical protein
VTLAALLKGAEPAGAATAAVESAATAARESAERIFGVIVWRRSRSGVKESWIELLALGMRVFDVMIRRRENGRDFHGSL